MRLARARSAGLLVLAGLGASFLACGLGVTGAAGPPDGGTSSGASLPPGVTDPGSSGTPGTTVLPDGAVVEAGPPCETEPALRFDGIDDVASVPDDLVLDLDHPFTVEAWVRPSKKIELPDVEMHIASHHSHDLDAGWVLLIKAQRVELRIYGFSGPQTAGDAAPAGYVVGDAWAHVAGTWDGTTLRTYYAGARRDEQVVPTAFDRQNYPGRLTFGRASYASMFHFEGTIDDVRISSRARYTAETAPKPPAPFGEEPGTIGLWKFDEQSGRAIGNSAGVSHNGSLGTMNSVTSEPSRVLTTCTASR